MITLLRASSIMDVLQVPPSGVSEQSNNQRVPLIAMLEIVECAEMEHNQNRHNFFAGGYFFFADKNVKKWVEPT